MTTNAERLELRRKRMAESLPILRGGFRPFFLGSAAWAIGALAVWLAIFFGQASPPFRGDPLAWHRHEMLFGFVGAAIAGFALTAVPNWTGRLPIAGWPLAALFVFWAAGRLLAFLVGPQSVLLIGIDGGFYLLLAALLGREIIQSGNRNLPVVAIIALFGVANLGDRIAMGGIADPGPLDWRAGLALVILLIGVIGGRIIPSFTRNWLTTNGIREALPTQPDTFDKLVPAATSIALILWLLLPFSPATGAVLLLTAAAHWLRLVRWQGWRCWSNPLLIVLHVGYVWLPIGLFLLALAQFAIVAESSAIHALSAGAMTTMILAVMSRASLGHTGRPLVAGPIATAAFALVTLAAAARVIAALSSRDQTILLMLAGIGWFGGFGLFLFEYGPILCKGRADERLKEAAP